MTDSNRLHEGNSQLQKSYPPDAPIYRKIWENLKQFPGKLASGSQHPPETSGPAAAAILSASFSCFFLMVNQHLTMLFPAYKEFVWTLGAWIPGSHSSDPLYGSIGPYAGKETLLLIGWLGSWALLHWALRRRQIRPGTVFFWTIAFLIAAVVMNWHPLFPYAPLS